MGVGFPSGPTTSSTVSPATLLQSSLVVLPMAWTMMVMLPFAGSLSAIVRGIRSPPSSTRTMMKFPARRFRATNGASITNLVIVGASRSVIRILYIPALPLC